MVILLDTVGFNRAFLGFLPYGLEMLDSSMGREIRESSEAKMGVVRRVQLSIFAFSHSSMPDDYHSFDKLYNRSHLTLDFSLFWSSYEVAPGPNKSEL